MTHNDSCISRRWFLSGVAGTFFASSWDKSELLAERPPPPNLVRQGTGVRGTNLERDSFEAPTMTTVEGQFAFVGEIPLTGGALGPPKAFIDTTTRAVPGLVHASIHRRIDGEGIVIYEARIGGPDDAATYLRSLEGHLEKLRWYRPVGRWANPGGVRRVAFMRTFRVIPDAGAKETVVAKLANLVELVVGQVPTLKLAILHEGLERPLEVMLYEEWDDTKDRWLANEATKPYRAAYRDETAHLIAEPGNLEWLSPIRIYEV